MERKRWLQLFLSLGLPCIGLGLDLFVPDALGALCSVRGITQQFAPAAADSSDRSERVK
jgi:hypothetical protein